MSNRKTELNDEEQLKLLGTIAIFSSYNNTIQEIILGDNNFFNYCCPNYLSQKCVIVGEITSLIFRFHLCPEHYREYLNKKTDYLKHKETTKCLQDIDISLKVLINELGKSDLIKTIEEIKIQKT